jgi:DNA-binding IscR family transcriptional regulator
LQLTYATQHVKKLDAAEFAKMRKQGKCFLANNQTVIRVMEYVLNAFERKDQKPVSVEAVAYRLGMPTDFTEKILDRMVQSNLLCRTDDPAVGYVPSTDGSHITLDEISRAIGEVSFAQVEKDRTVKMQEVFVEADKLLNRYTLKEILNRSENFELQQQLMEEPEQADADQENI